MGVINKQTSLGGTILNDGELSFFLGLNPPTLAHFDQPGCASQLGSVVNSLSIYIYMTIQLEVNPFQTKSGPLS